MAQPAAQAPGLNVVVTELPDAAAVFEVLGRPGLQVLELYTEWAGPTAACKSTWRKAALERGGALPCELSTACVERCGGVAGLEPYLAAPTSQPLFLFFKGGKRVAEVRGVNPPALLRELAAAEGTGTVAAVRESECC
ncbi:flagellar outer dynein arm light chain thioredoxin [Chlorella sorokiniana]|uniref:Flagellar outer dynein arm light chain thioredoxin n=1 Tax=Chlorella sorokiniana TaxID=3076 RepID=A0A2P6TVX2_CHLSO|nr:flagellar outer dynein arm light chain thioredoxin [Chlorella sorokiniana]|eukprot:PRW58219.1 flagellar outer dynein arm light chain thioredoxin [Chlorella sorokiniana]